MKTAQEILDRVEQTHNGEKGHTSFCKGCVLLAITLTLEECEKKFEEKKKMWLEVVQAADRAIDALHKHDIEKVEQHVREECENEINKAEQRGFSDCLKQIIVRKECFNPDHERLEEKARQDIFGKDYVERISNEAEQRGFMKHVKQCDVLGLCFNWEHKKKESRKAEMMR